MSSPVAPASASIKSTDVSIPSADGLLLGGLLFEPTIPARAAVQLNMATGAGRGYYVPFARYLAEHGFVVCLWEYRGGKYSRPVPLRDSGYRFLDYGTKDMPAVLDWLEARFPGLPLLLVGHSVGAQQVGFMPNLHKLRGLVAVATSVGYWGYMPLGYRLKTHFFFHLFSPLSHLLVGYNAAGRWGIMEDLPRGVVDDWRRWCSVPDYFFDKRFVGQLPPHQYHKYTFPVAVFWTTDDPISNSRSVPQFWQHVRSTQDITIHRLEPAALGVRAIGHFGFFRRHMRTTFWPQVVAALDGMLA